MHLSGKEGKKHAYYKNIYMNVTGKLANRGWTLQSEFIQIVSGEYDCRACQKRKVGIRSLSTSRQTNIVMVATPPFIALCGPGGRAWCLVAVPGAWWLRLVPGGCAWCTCQARRGRSTLTIRTYPSMSLRSWPTGAGHCSPKASRFL